jgi:predicted ATP-grasp superfamily ATP-dependent carboligase
MGLELHSSRGSIVISPSVPAVVLGAGVNGLGVVRSLARADVPVWLLDSDVHSPEMRTRVARSLRIRTLHGETLIEELERLGNERFAGLRPVLFLTQEETVKMVSHHRDRLSPFYRFSLPARDTADTLMHKHGFQRLAERYNAPIPKLVHVGTRADLAALDGLRYPVVAKPGERNAEYSRHFRKAYRVENITEARDLVQRILAVMPDVVVQEWIEGPDSNIHFCLQYLDRGSEVVASFTGRKVRSWPPEVGGTASCTAAPEADAELSAITSRFFKAAGVTGMAGMEYKRDARDGTFRLVEPTIGRTDYQEEVATLNGVNLPHAAYCCELGLPTPVPVPVVRPIGWRVRTEDIQSAALQGQSPAHGWPAGGRVVDAMWRWTDPAPYLFQNLRRIRRALRNRISKPPGQSRVAGGTP